MRVSERRAFCVHLLVSMGDVCAPMVKFTNLRKLSALQLIFLPFAEAEPASESIPPTFRQTPCWTRGAYVASDAGLAAQCHRLLAPQVLALRNSLQLVLPQLPRVGYSSVQRNLDRHCRRSFRLWLWQHSWRRLHLSRVKEGLRYGKACDDEALGLLGLHPVFAVWPWSDKQG